MDPWARDRPPGRSHRLPPGSYPRDAWEAELVGSQILLSAASESATETCLDRYVTVTRLLGAPYLRLSTASGGESFDGRGRPR